MKAEPRDPHEARMLLANWLVEILEELDQDFVDDAETINKLRGKVAEALAELRTETGYGMGGPGRHRAGS